MVDFTDATRRGLQLRFTPLGFFTFVLVKDTLRPYSKLVKNLHRNSHLKLGIHASNARSAGGQIQVLLMMLSALYESEVEWEIYLLSFQDSENLEATYKKPNWHHINLCQALGLTEAPKEKSAHTAEIAAYLQNELKLDLLLFPTWTDGGQDWGIPFIFTVHDTQHRMQPEFPEVSAGRELGASWRWREKLFSESTASAKAVLVDSEEGKNIILKYYDLAPEKVHPLPYTLPPSLLRHPSDAEIEEVAEKFSLPKRYVFYPAQLWPHKNHYRIVEAVGILAQEKGLRVPLVFAGGENPLWNVRDVCEALAERDGTEDLLHFLGYVSDSDLAALFAGAEMLCMPTFFGPTNIPYLEAFHHRVPVIASDLPGIREQVADAALLADPRDPDSLAFQIASLWQNKELQESLRVKGEARMNELSPKIFQENLLSFLEKLASSL